MYSVTLPGFEHSVEIEAVSPSDAALIAVLTFDRIITEEHNFSGNVAVAETGGEGAADAKDPGIYEFDLDEIIESFLADED